MKNLLFAMFALASVLTFNSCEKETNLTLNPQFNALPSNFQADLDSTTFTFNVSRSIESNGQLNLVGVKDSFKLTIVTSSTKPGTYLTEYHGLNNVNLYVNEGASGTYSSAFVPTPNMKIVISSFDATTNSISGTLNGLIQDINTGDSIRITNGIFTNLKLTKGPGFNLGSMSAKIDTVPFNSYFSVQTTTNSGQIVKQINGSNSEGTQSIKLIFLKRMEVGTFTFDAVNYKAQYFESLSSSIEDEYEAITGSVTISKIDTIAKVVVGTFNCDVENVDSKIVKITDGKFEAAIQ